ncbi:hypothetical protein ACJ41O_004202 [Fusarium nematophilum]
MIPSSLAFYLGLSALALAARPRDAIKLSDVQSLTLRGKGAMTNHRRVSAIPQLRCVSRKALCDLYDIDVMRCTNQGSSWGDEDIQWSCIASLPEELKLGSTDVICEGYSYPEDPYVLKGSCGVEYQVALTRKGEQRYPDIANGGWFNDGRGGIDWGALVFTVIFVAILCWIIYSACCRPRNMTVNTNNPPRRRRDGWPPGGWGPGWGPGDDPPPPYPGSKPPGTDSWTPGFWSGMAGGAAAGYLAGNRNSNNHHHHHDNHNNGYGSIGRGGGWGWGGSGSSSGSNSSNRHESTGFGSTSRR